MACLAVGHFGVGGDHLWRPAGCSDPVSRFGAHPTDQFQQLPMVSGQVAPMDRLMVGNPIPEEMKALHPIGHVDSDLFGVAR